MKILFTGVTSFTGFWFVTELINAGHEVTAICTQPESNYGGSKKARLDKLKNSCELIYSCAFGSDDFLDILNQQKGWNLLCHHAADVNNYKSFEFDYLRALRNNSSNIVKVLRTMVDVDCQSLLLTGSVFEGAEGLGDKPMLAFSPYGLSKQLTGDVFTFYANAFNIKLGKFLIPNPFGAFEEPRFTAYLIKNWKNGKVPGVNTPAYIRDNIHADLLAKCYSIFAERLVREKNAFDKMNPSGYVENQGAFATRFAQEMSSRLNIRCDLNLEKQVDFSEPYMRINNESGQIISPSWDESAAWDSVANFYSENFLQK